MPPRGPSLPPLPPAFPPPPTCSPVHDGSKLALAGEADEEEQGAHAKHGGQREGAHLQERDRRRRRRDGAAAWLVGARI